MTITVETFLFLLLVVSILTGLATEGIKLLLDEAGMTYKSNLLAAAVSVFLSVLVGIAYVVLMEAQINAKLAVILIALILLSWLSAMLGYDKVMQSITQIKTSKNN